MTEVNDLHPQRAKPVDAAALPRCARRVLIVDDDEFICHTLAHQLRSMGAADVTAVSDEPEAVRLLNGDGEVYSLIVSDLSMPKVDGIQLMRLIAARQSGTAVLFISAAGRKLLTSAEELARERGLRVTALEKPIKLEELRRALTELDSAAAQAPAGRQQPVPSAADLRKGLEDDEIQVYVQPQLDARSGELRGVEALARWYSPKHGLVMPDHFVDLAQRSGLIDTFTGQMLAKSVAHAAQWQEAGIHPQLAVNTPVSSMSRLHLPDTIAGLLKRHGIAAERLTLEITEATVMHDALRSLDALTRLRLRGISLAIDDFGCGNSSLQYLKRMPFNELKVDASFVKAMFRDPEAHTLVRSSIGLARELGLRSIAEGVESQEHWDAVASMGVDAVQGFYVARAFPAAQLPEWLRSKGRTFLRTMPV